MCSHPYYHPKKENTEEIKCGLENHNLEEYSEEEGSSQSSTPSIHEVEGDAFDTIQFGESLNEEELIELAQQILNNPNINILNQRDEL
jgi:hypothetical protein